jgi:hypothetical protein
MSDDQHYGLVLPFDTDDSQFVRGFEAGRLWEQTATGEPFSQTIHSSNTEMAIRICEAREMPFSAEQLDDNWTELSVG